MRPTASIIVPFLGDNAQLALALARLARVRREPADELIIVDNRNGSCSSPALGATHGARVIGAGDVHSAAFARNAGAAAATGEWLVFLDVDVVAREDLLAHYLEPAPGVEVGVLAGGIRDIAATATRSARYVVARAKMDERIALASARGPYAQSANCAVRARAFAEVGGFEPRARAGEDADLCWRLAAAGWALEHRPRASVEHLARTSLRQLVVQLAAHGSGMAWLDRRYPGAFPAPGLRELAGRVPRHLLAAARAPGEERVFALIDLIALCARDAGRLRSNAPVDRGGARSQAGNRATAKR